MICKIMKNNLALQDTQYNRHKRIEEYDISGFLEI